MPQMADDPRPGHRRRAQRAGRGDPPRERTGSTSTVLEHAPASGRGVVVGRGDAAGVRPRPLRGVRADGGGLARDPRAGAGARRAASGSIPPSVMAHPFEDGERDRPASRRRGDGRLARSRRRAAGGRRCAGCCRWRRRSSRACSRRCRRCGSAARLAAGTARRLGRVDAAAARVGRGARARPVRRRPPRDRMAGGLGPALRPAAVDDASAARSASCCSCSATATAGRSRAAGWASWPARWCGAPSARARGCAARRPSPACWCAAGGSQACGSPAARRSPPTRSSRPSAPACSARLLPGRRAAAAPAAAAASGGATAPASFKLDYALVGAGPVDARRRRATPRSCTSAATLDELSVAAQAAQRGELPERPALVVGQQSRYDRSRVPGAGETLYVYGHVPAGYERDRRRSSSGSRRSSSASRPASPRSCARGRRARRRSPSARTRASSAATSAAAPTSSTSSSSSGPPRSSPATARRSRGLYVAGASTHPGGAVHGVSGRGAARALLSDRRLRPWR